MSGAQTPTEVEDLDFEGLTLDEQHKQQERAIIQGGDDDELERFRREWRAEVTKQRQPQPQGLPGKGKPGAAAEPPAHERVTAPRSPETKTTTSRSTALARSPSPVKSYKLPENERDRSPTKVKAPSSFATSRIHDPTAGATAGPSRPKTQYSAVQLYAQAVESEQSGQLNDALLLYRRAFKLDGMCANLKGKEGNGD